MADDLENSGQWRDTVETRLGTLETRVDEEARLRAAMDEDMGNLKAEWGAHKKIIQAIADTQSDHTRRLTKLETGVEELRTGLGKVQAGVKMIITLLGGNPGDIDI